MDLKITQREYEVASCLVQGLTNYEISHTLGISTHMVKIYIANLLQKFDAKNRTRLAYLLGKNNVIRS